MHPCILCICTSMSPKIHSASLSSRSEMASLIIPDRRVAPLPHSVSAPSSPALWTPHSFGAPVTASLPSLGSSTINNEYASSTPPQSRPHGSFAPACGSSSQSPAFLQTPLEPYCPSLESMTTGEYSGARSSLERLVSDMQPSPPSRLQIPNAEGRAPSVAQDTPPISPAISLDMFAPSPMGSDLMVQDFHQLSLAGTSPTSSTALSPRCSLAGSRRSLRSVPTSPASQLESPSSAAALSFPITQPATQSSYQEKKPLYSRGRTSPPSRTTRRPRHSMFYMRDEMVTFIVEDCLYRVHRHHLERDSEYFRRLFFSRSGDDGRSDETAIPLPEVLQHEFDCLLHFLYYRVYDADSVSLNEWIVLLGISTQLRFLKIRQYAIREITLQRAALNPVETVVLATTHDVPEWLAPAFADLSRRAHPLDDLEAEQLGAQITARIGRAREALRDETFGMFQRRRYGSRYSVPDSYDDEVVARVVAEVFWPGTASAS